MIQRIQSLYIVLGTCLGVVAFFILPYLTCPNMDKSFYMINNLPVLCLFILICLMAFLCFKNRTRQIQMIYIVSLLSSIIILSTFFTLPEDIHVMDCDFYFLIIPILITSKLFFYMAIRSIKKDASLINSINRLR